MKLKAKLLKAAYDALDEALKAFYSQSGDDFVLQVEGIQEHPEATGLKTALDNVRAELKTAKTDLAKFSYIPDDMTADKFNALLDSNDGKTVDEKLTAQSQRLTNQFNAEKAKLEEQVAKYKGMTEKISSDLALTSALAEAKIKPEMLEAVSSMFAGKVKVEFEGDKPIVTIDNTEVGAAIKSWAESDKGKPFVAADLNGGGGSQGGKGGVSKDEVNPWAKETENLTQQMMIQKNDPAKAEKLKALAGVVSKK